MKNPINIYPSTNTSVENYEESLTYYYNDVNKQGRITAGEEAKLIVRAEQGDQEAINRLVCGNLPLAIKIAKDLQHHYPHCGLFPADFIEAANFGLIQAANKVKANKGAKFGTYAAYWIRNAIDAAVKEATPKGSDYTMITIPLDNYRDDDEDCSLLDRLPQECVDAPDFTIGQGNLSNTLSIAMHNTLSQKEIDILCRYYGIGRKPMSGKDIAEEYGLSRERISQIIHQASEKLEKSKYSKELRMCI